MTYNVKDRNKLHYEVKHVMQYVLVYEQDPDQVLNSKSSQCFCMVVENNPKGQVKIEVFLY